MPQIETRTIVIAVAALITVSVVWRLAETIRLVNAVIKHNQV